MVLLSNGKMKKFDIPNSFWIFYGFVPALTPLRLIVMIHGI